MDEPEISGQRTLPYYCNINQMSAFSSLLSRLAHIRIRNNHIEVEMGLVFRDPSPSLALGLSLRRGIDVVCHFVSRG